MLTDRGFSHSTTPDNLTIHQGDSLSLESVQSFFQAGNLPQIIISGLGNSPTGPVSFTWTGKVTFPKETLKICEDSMRSILEAVKVVQKTEPGYRPKLVVISTTGVDAAVQDVPFGMYTFYHHMLDVPHQDKRAQESLLTNSITSSHVDWMIVRPTWLTDSVPVGQDKIKIGWQIPGTKEFTEEDEERVGRKWGAVKGYTVSRGDVARWIYENRIKESGERWDGKAVTLAN